MGAHAIEDGRALLVTLDALLRSDPKPAKFEASICICVRGSAADHYWAAVVGPEVRCGFVDGVPPGTDAILLLGRREADAILKTGVLPRNAELARIGGDQRALASFFHTYTAHSSWLDIRSGGRRAKDTRRMR